MRKQQRLSWLRWWSCSWPVADVVACKARPLVAAATRAVRAAVAWDRSQAFELARAAVARPMSMNGSANHHVSISAVPVIRCLFAACLRTLWGSRFVQGCDMCSTGCDSCSSGEACGCGYASAGGSGCTSCGGGGGMVSGGGTCSSCAGGATVTEPMMPSAAAHMPAHDHTVQAGSEPRMVPGSFKISQPRRVPASVASERINPARQKMDAKRASYTN